MNYMNFRKIENSLKICIIHKGIKAQLLTRKNIKISLQAIKVIKKEQV